MAILACERASARMSGREGARKKNGWTGWTGWTVGSQVIEIVEFDKKSKLGGWTAQQ
jgi:hypothetical protein